MLSLSFILPHRFSLAPAVSVNALPAVGVGRRRRGHVRRRQFSGSVQGYLVPCCVMRRCDGAAVGAGMGDGGIHGEAAVGRAQRGTGDTGWNGSAPLAMAMVEMAWRVAREVAEVNSKV